MYRKIDIHVGPTLVTATLEKRNVCDCGMNIVRDEAPIGTEFNADLKSVRWVKFVCHGCGKKFVIRIIDVWGVLLTPQWFPLACLDIDAGIPYAPIPTEWRPVKDNMVAPAHGLPGKVV